jgi:hypothetical protein
MSSGKGSQPTVRGCESLATCECFSIAGSQLRNASPLAWWLRGIHVPPNMPLSVPIPIILLAGGAGCGLIPLSHQRGLYDSCDALRPASNLHTNISAWQRLLLPGGFYLAQVDATTSLTRGHGAPAPPSYCCCGALTSVVGLSSFQ